jgi:hypothetical protein
MLNQYHEGANETNFKEKPKKKGIKLPNLVRRLLSYCKMIYHYVNIIITTRIKKIGEQNFENEDDPNDLSLPKCDFGPRPTDIISVCASRFETQKY